MSRLSKQAEGETTMETQQFDRITSSLAASQTRRSALRTLAAAAFGAGSLAILGREEIVAKKKRKGKKRRGGSRNGGQGGSGSGSGGSGSGNNGGSSAGSGSNGGSRTFPTIVGGGSTRPDRCGGPVGICNADPTPCGTTAEGAICGCERAVEGNNVCVNSGADNVCDTAVECTSTDGEEETSCRNLVGFHFYCQEAKMADKHFCGCGFGTMTGRVCVPACDNPYQ
jgi:hypothetical protein